MTGRSEYSSNFSFFIETPYTFKLVFIADNLRDSSASVFGKACAVYYNIGFQARAVSKDKTRLIDAGNCRVGLNLDFTSTDSPACTDIRVICEQDWLS